MKQDLILIGEENREDETFSVMSTFPKVKSITYDQVLTGSGKIATGAPIMLCFPYSPWNNMVEKKDVLYGVSKFGYSIRNLAEMITETMQKRFPDANYVNPPMSLLLERDKLNAKKILAKEGIVVAENIEKSLDAVLEEVEKGNSVYIKARYGSMGKGITYVSKDKWTTNFKYDGTTISNHESDSGWKEIQITGDEQFIKTILSEDVVVEKGVENSKTNGLKFDLRGRTLFGEFDPKDAYGRGTNDQSITNIVQGASMMSLKEMERYVPHEKLIEGLEVVRQSAKILKLNYAGGDILFEGDSFKPVFLEINSFPGVLDREFFQKVYNSIKTNMLS